MNDQPKPDNDLTQLTPEEKTTLDNWLASPVPGEDRLHALTIPTPPSRTIKPKHSFAWYYRIAAGMALFFAGYIAGNADWKPQQIALVVSSPGSSQKDNLIIDDSTLPPSTNQIVTAPDSPSVNAPQSNQSSTEDCASPQIYQGDDGRIRINTVLCKTGSHATWIVNSKLELAKLPDNDNNVEEN